MLSRVLRVAAVCCLLSLCVSSGHAQPATQADQTPTQAQSSPNTQSSPRPLTLAASSNSQLPTSKYTNRSMLTIEDVIFGSDASKLTPGTSNKMCPLDISLIWMNTMSTGIYSSSIIHHLDSPQLIVPGFNKDLNILDLDGHHIQGSPYNMQDDIYFHAAPVLVDYNRDGLKDIVWVNVNADIYIMNGDPYSEILLLSEIVSVPKLKVHRFWYQHNNGTSPASSSSAGSTAVPSPARRLLSVERSKPLHPHTVKKGRDMLRALQKNAFSNPKTGQVVSSRVLRRLLQIQEGQPQQQQQQQQQPPATLNGVNTKIGRGRRADAEQAAADIASDDIPDEMEEPEYTDETPISQLPLRPDIETDDPNEPLPDGTSVDDQEDNDDEAEQHRMELERLTSKYGAEGASPAAAAEADQSNDDDLSHFAYLTDDQMDAMIDDLLQSDPNFASDSQTLEAADEPAAQPDDAQASLEDVSETPSASNPEGIASKNAAPDATNIDDILSDALKDQLGDGLTEEALESLSLFADQGSAYSPEQQEEMDRLAAMYPTEDGKYVWVDAHVMSTPVLYDMNGDNFPELIMTVTYFFDETDYHAHPHLFAHLGADVDIRKYVAGGIVAVDLLTRRILWAEHLDLTTDDTELKAFVYASPTIVDLDGDGDVEVIVGTSLGFIYAFHLQTQRLLPNFPIVMSEIQGQVAVEDVNGDGLLEMVAMDSKGNVLCFNKQGQEIWSRSISGFSASSATFGDVNGDDVMDVIIATVSGHVWALKGTDGSVLPYFPLKTDGRIIAPVTLVDLSPPRGIPFRNTNGLHLVFPSFDGHVYIVDGRSGCINKLDIGEHSYGMVLADDILGRGKLDLLVTTMNGNVFLFSTEGEYTPLKAWRSPTHGLNGFTAQEGYHGVFWSEDTKQRVERRGRSIELEYVIVDDRPKLKLATGAKRDYVIEVSYGGSLIVTLHHTKPGFYTTVIDSPHIPGLVHIELVMWNEHKQYFHDSVTLSVNTEYYKTIKYMVLAPLIVMISLVVYMKGWKPAYPS